LYHVHPVRLNIASCPDGTVVKETVWVCPVSGSFTFIVNKAVPAANDSDFLIVVTPFKIRFVIVGAVLTSAMNQKKATKVLKVYDIITTIIC